MKMLGMPYLLLNAWPFLHDINDKIHKLTVKTSMSNGITCDHDGHCHK